MKTNTYNGFRRRWGAQVLVNGGMLPRRKDLRFLCRKGFNWGYHSAGASQLALAILAFEFGDGIAGKWHLHFKRDVIAGLGDIWILTSEYLRLWLDRQIARVESLSAPE